MLRSGQFGDQKVGCAAFVGIIAMNFVHPVYVGASGRLSGAPRAPRHTLSAQFVTNCGYGFAAMRKIAITISASVTYVQVRSLPSAAE
jgi:hypothetical protein